MSPQQSIELSTIWQIRKGCMQMLLSIAIKGSFALELSPLSKEGQSHDLAALQGLRPSGHWFFIHIGMQLAKIIGHDVQCCQESFQVSHQLAPSI
jgi:hypothetical protein